MSFAATPDKSQDSAVPLVAPGAISELTDQLRALWKRERALRLPEYPRLAAIEAIARDIAAAEPDALAAPDDAPHEHPARVRMRGVLQRIVGLWDPWQPLHRQYDSPPPAKTEIFVWPQNGHAEIVTTAAPIPTPAA